MVVELLVDYISGYLFGQIKIIRLDVILYVPGFSPLSFGEPARMTGSDGGWGEVTQAAKVSSIYPATYYFPIKK